MKFIQHTRICIAAIIAFYVSNLHAHEHPSMIENLTGFNINKTEFMQKMGLSLDGWVEAGFAINPKDPDNRSNTPVTFNDRANEFHLHSLYTSFARDVDKSKDDWDIGFRADLLFGTDARFTLHENLDDNLISDSTSEYYKLSFPQLYVDLFVPIGNGLTASIGHFYTIIGKEMIPAPDNFFFSHAFTMQYSEPFTHTGVLLKYKINKNYRITAGIVSGWDSFLNQPLNFLGNICYLSTDKRMSLVASIVSGPAPRNNKNSHRSMYSIVFDYKITDKFEYTLEHDFGIEENRMQKGKSAVWYGLNQYFIYHYSDKLKLGLRAEWYRDANGARVAYEKNSYFSLTGGVNWFAKPWLVIRPEIRYDIATSNAVFNDNKDKTQFLFSVDAVLHF